MKGIFPTHLVTVRVERTLNRLYPVGSDTPIPDSAVVEVKPDPLGSLPSRSNLREGDVILDGYGAPYVIGVRRDPEFSGLNVLHAYQADRLEDATISELEAPISLLARCGAPVDGVMFS